MIRSDKVHQILYGGDYNPEQWNDDVRAKDMELLPAAGVNIVTLNVFNWAMLQPSEEVYDFSALDETVDRVTCAGMQICMATGTAAMPAWMARRHPDILRTEFNGMRRKFGARHNCCPSSPTYRLYAPRLAAKLAQRYGEKSNIVAWHVSNEYGQLCYCDNCAKGFRAWLQNKYGSIEALNDAWNTHFWGHTFYDFDEIEAPSLLTEHFESNRSMFPCITLDYYRFYSDAMLENYKAEAAAIREFIPDAQITTNLMGFFKDLDYGKWAKEMDFISWDNYPNAGDSVALSALRHDLMRGLKPGLPFALMEQTPSVSNWHQYATLKRPGQMRLMSYQAVAHGADTVMFFQMRQSVAECEKLHSGIISHVGTPDTRIYQECKALGEELRSLGDTLLGSLTPARVAILFDWENWWAIEMTSGLNMDLKYIEEVQAYYEALQSYGVQVDVVGVDAPLSPYKLVIAPTMYMVKAGIAERLEEYTRAGGSVLFSIYSGMADERDHCTISGYPGSLRRLMGIWIEEFDSLPPDEKNTFTWRGKNYESSLMFGLAHAEGAEVLTTYEEDFYAGMPVVTRNKFGEGSCYYVGTRANATFYQDFLSSVCQELGILPVGAQPLEEGLEYCERANKEKIYGFYLNHKGEVIHKAEELTVTVRKGQGGKSLLTGKTYLEGDMLTLSRYGVEILERSIEE